VYGDRLRYDDQPAPDPARCFDCPPVDPAPAVQWSNLSNLIIVVCLAYPLRCWFISHSAKERVRPAQCRRVGAAKPTSHGQGQHLVARRRRSEGDHQVGQAVGRVGRPAGCHQVGDGQGGRSGRAQPVLHEGRSLRVGGRDGLQL